MAFQLSAFRRFQAGPQQPCALGKSEQLDIKKLERQQKEGSPRI
jgi:hypothetical protein